MRPLSWFASVLLIATALPALAAEDRVHWQPNLETAQRLAGQTDRLVLVHFWGPNCGPCMKMEKEVFSKAETADALEANFVPVKLNVEEFPATARLYNITRIPADLVLTPTGRVVAQFQSPQTATLYVNQVTQLARGYRELARSTAAAGANASTVAAMVPEGASQSVGQAPWNSAQPNQPPAGGSPYNNDRYADYMRSSTPPAQASVPGSQQAPASYAPPIVSTGAPQLPSKTTDPRTFAASNYAPPSASLGTQTSPALPQQPAPQAMQLPAGSPPLALDGYSPVTISTQHKWTPGNPQWGAIHRGHTYLFTSQEEQQMFLASPDAYSPVNSGNDPVIALDSGQLVPGTRSHGVDFNHRIYLFSSEETLRKFYQNPSRYTAEVIQAMRPTSPTLR